MRSIGDILSVVADPPGGKDPQTAWQNNETLPAEQVWWHTLPDGILECRYCGRRWRTDGQPVHQHHWYDGKCWTILKIERMDERGRSYDFKKAVRVTCFCVDKDLFGVERRSIKMQLEAHFANLDARRRPKKRLAIEEGELAV